MQVDLNELANSYEVVPVSLSDPFKSLIAEPSTMEVLRFLPIMAFIALIITAIWRQGKKFPVRAIGDLNKDFGFADGILKRSLAEGRQKK